MYNYLGMKVYNSQGQLLNGSSVNDVMVSPVYTGLVYGRVIPIDLTKLPAGIYFVKFYYDAVSDVRLLHIPHEQFIATISSSPETLRAVLTLLGKDYTALLLRVTGLSQSRTIDKICYTLYYLLFRYGQEKTPGEFTINLKLSQSMLADLIGQTREGTAKNIKILREKEIISYSSLTYVVNKKKLEQFLGEDSFRDIKLS